MKEIFESKLHLDKNLPEIRIARTIVICAFFCETLYFFEFQIVYGA